MHPVVRRWKLALLGLALAALVGVPVLLLIQDADRKGADHAYLPPMVMVYQVDGPNVDGVQTREMRRLEYQSRTHWTEAVIEGPSTMVRTGDFQGEHSNVGSYRQLRGRQLTQYHAYTDSYREETIEPNTTFIPNAALRSHNLDLLLDHRGVKLTPVTTSSTVCYRDDCQENAPGLLYVTEYGQEQVFVEDRRWDIPLRLGDTFFVVREVRIEAERP